MKQKGFAPIIIIIILVVISALVILILKGVNPKKVNPKPTLTPMPTAMPTANNIDTTDWKTYTNTEFGFQMRYPKEFNYVDNGPVAATSSGNAVLGRISFADSNKNTFDVNIFPVFNDSASKDLESISLTSGYCGAPNVEKTIVNKIFKEGPLTYKQVAQVDRTGRNLTDFCFFSPSGNLIVLRNNIGSTVIAMKQIMSDFLFSGQTDKSGMTLYINPEHKFSFKYPKEFVSGTVSQDAIPANSIGSIIINVRSESSKSGVLKPAQAANFAVSKSDDLEACFKNLAGKMTLNGRDYKSGREDLDVTGVKLEALTLRTVKNGCYEVRSSLQTSTGSATVDTAGLKAQLNKILPTFYLFN